MVFSSLIFLFVFLPSVLGCYYVAPRPLRNSVLLFFSYLFYLWGSGEILCFLIASTAVNYAFGLLINRVAKKYVLKVVIVAIFINLLTLAYFKYSNFFIGEFNKILLVFDRNPIDWKLVMLPIGISFFTFHNISYLVDVYRGKRKAFLNLIDFALYIAFFPQLIAGPIVRFHEISEQLRERKETLDDFYKGILRFCFGLVKKALFANTCGDIADAIFALAPGTFDMKIAWLGAISYTLQIYLDFSAYSDMAIGLGMMFGLHLPENFNRPYSADSVTDFWRRWHMSLSRFFRDYLYIPLGGNRKGVARMYFNLITVFLLCGLWHGASYTFLIWGAYHGTLLITERMLNVNDSSNIKFIYIIRRFFTLFFVMVGWVFFRASDMSHALDFLKSMVTIKSMPIPVELIFSLNRRNYILLAISATVFFFPKQFSGHILISKNYVPTIEILKIASITIAIIYSVAFIASGSYNPFIYFQF